MDGGCTSMCGCCAPTLTKVLHRYMERFGDLPETASDPPGRGSAYPPTTHNPFPTPGILRPQKRPQRARLTLRIRALNITADGPGGCGHVRRSEGPSNVKRARCESRDGPGPVQQDQGGKGVMDHYVYDKSELTVAARASPSTLREPTHSPPMRAKRV